MSRDLLRDIAGQYHNWVKNRAVTWDAPLQRWVGAGSIRPDRSEGRYLFRVAIIKPMSILTADHIDAVRRLPAGATLTFHAFGWDEYERLLEDLSEWSHVRVSYDRGKLEIMSPLPEHEDYARLIDDLVRALSDRLDLRLEKRGSATWKRRSLARGVEPDACYFVRNADRIIGKRPIDLESDPPPDIAVEIDVTNESLGKFPIYSALAVPEIWRYDGRTVQFYELGVDVYQEVPESRSFPGLKPAMLAEALEQSKTEGQTAALAAFRQRLQRFER